MNSETSIIKIKTNYFFDTQYYNIKMFGGKIKLDEKNFIIVQKICYTIPHHMIEYSKDLLTLKSEMCGVYVIDKIKLGNKDIDTEIYDYGDVVLTNDLNVKTYVNETTSRGNCTIVNKEYYGIIWHTHPNTSKYYPSIEDLLTLVKTRFKLYNCRSIKLSIIYTKYGIWILRTHDFIKDVTYLIHKITKLIESANYDFYTNTNNGRKYCNKEIKKYIDALRKYFNIKFFTYEDCDRKDLKGILNDIRLDSLSS